LTQETPRAPERSWGPSKALLDLTAAKGRAYRVSGSGGYRVAIDPPPAAFGTTVRAIDPSEYTGETPAALRLRADVLEAIAERDLDGAVDDWDGRIGFDLRASWPDSEVRYTTWVVDIDEAIEALRVLLLGAGFSPGVVSDRLGSR
jgi:hypothetical protein